MGLSAEFEILFHPDMKLQPKEVALIYSSDGKSWEDYFANRLTEKNWNVTMYDLQVDQQIEFFIRVIVKDGRIMLVRKEGQNYKVKVRDNTSSEKYKAQIRITDDILSHAGRRCLICDQVIPKNKNLCQTDGCSATYCPYCQRMLPPFSNFCPWDKKSFAVR